MGRQPKDERLAAMSDARLAKAGGEGPQLLLLLHGLGATAEVWDGWGDLLAHTWPGRWLAPDLPGHGSSPPLRRYSFGAMAAAVSEILPPSDRLVVVGHSLGGVVALALSSGWFGPRVDQVVGVGIKVAWTAQELARAASLASRPVDWFASQAEAADRHLRVSGLAGLREADDPMVVAGLREQHGRWRLSLDPAAFGVGAPDLSGLLTATRAAVVLARGEHDPLVSDDQLAELSAEGVVLRGLGHNAHVEDPRAVASLLRPGASDRAVVR
jgi:pimeloyl-ACP methyl ester carboxylesterase